MPHVTRCLLHDNILLLGSGGKVNSLPELAHLLRQVLDPVRGRKLLSHAKHLGALDDFVAQVCMQVSVSSHFGFTGVQDFGLGKLRVLLLVKILHHLSVRRHQSDVYVQCPQTGLRVDAGTAGHGPSAGSPLGKFLLLPPPPPPRRLLPCRQSAT